ncbi:hypothetical protein VUR80DRAFT_1936 [Thermomyces stellatus]
MAARLSPFLRFVRTAAPLQTFARPLRTRFPAARHQGFATTTRLWHDENTPPNASSKPPSDRNRIPVKPDSYYLQFTCRPCGERSSHNISKQGYHHGSVLVTCPGCKNRHVISDHLNIFGDRKVTIEELVREQGGIVRKGTLDNDGDVEFWSEKAAEEEAKRASEQ